MWIVSALFCAVQYIDDTGYLPGEAILETDRVNKSRKNNMQCFQNRSVGPHKSLRNLEVIEFLVLKRYVKLISETSD